MGRALCLVAVVLVACGPQSQPEETTPEYRGALVPTRPAEAFDLEAIRSASLTDLAWTPLKDVVTASGVRVLEGTFSPGEYVGPIAGGGGTRAITLTSRARLYYPEDAAGTLPVVVYAAHVASLIAGPEESHARLAGGLRVALLVHGEEPSDAAALGYPTDTVQWRGDMVDDGVSDLMARNRCGAVDFQTSNYPYALARTSMLALTLAHRLLEAEGLEAGEAALKGGSKEGFATWVASASDDRLVLASPGGFHRQDLAALDAYEHNSGCGPNGNSPVVSVPAQLAMRDFLRDTPAGRAAARVLLVERFVAELRPEMFLIEGDTGMPGDHDGVFFTIGAETPFLDGFTAKPFRYHRTGSATNPKPEHPQELALLTQLLVAPDRSAELSAWVRVLSSAVVDAGVAGLTFTATVAPDPDLAQVRLHWAESEDREFNDAGQSPWQMVEMIAAGPGEYTSPPVVPASEAHEVAWYVEVAENVSLGDGVVLERRDAGPIRLARELPVLTCEGYPPIVCED